MKSNRPYIFFDYGAVWNKSIEEDSEDRNKKLYSFGLGLQLQLWKNLSTKLELAKPLSGIVGAESNDNPRIFFSISREFDLSDFKKSFNSK